MKATAPTFIENRGQFDQRVKFRVQGSGPTLWLTGREIVFDLLRTKPDGGTTPHEDGPALPHIGGRHPRIPDPASMERLVFSEEFLGANGDGVVEAVDQQPGIYNYFKGSDPHKWYTRVHAYSEVVYRDLWSGVDLKVHRNGPNLEQEFVVRPGGDLGRVQVAYRGIEGLRLGEDGSLVVRSAFGEFRESTPHIYQEIGGKHVPVEGRFKLVGETAYTFEVNAYQAEYALVIDPTLLYSTLLGGSGTDGASGIAVDASGAAYVTGDTNSLDFPITPGSYQQNVPPYPSAYCFVTKLNPLGSALVYSTYLGDSIQYCEGIGLDSAGDAYIVGRTGFSFPTTPNAYQTAISINGNPFVAKLNATGDTLLYSTVLGTGDFSGVFDNGGSALAIAVDSAGKAYITGSVQAGWPVTAGAFQPSFGGDVDAYVSVIDPSLSGAASLVYSTYLGGSDYDYGASIAVDAFGNVYVTGRTYGPHFPVTAGAFQTSYNGAGGSSEIFIAKLNPNVAGPSGLIYATYLGGSGTIINSQGQGIGDVPSAIAVDASGNAYVTGSTNSANFPVTPGAFQTTCAAGEAFFVSKLSTSGSQLVYSTCLNGNEYANNNSANGIAVDSLGNAYITGAFRTQASSTFPVTPNAFQSSFSKISGDYHDVFLTELNPTGSGLVYSTYLGGSGDDGAAAIALDPIGDVYLTGSTTSQNFPVTPFAFQPVLSPSSPPFQPDAFVTKFPLGAPQALSILGMVPTAGGNAGTVTPQITGTGFHAGATAQLKCGSAIVGANVSIGPGGRLLNTTFNLTAASPGTCDLVITNPDGTSATLSQAFTVQQGGAPNIRIEITGAARQTSEKPGTPTNAIIFATASNIGNVDSAPVFIAEPTSPGFSLTSVNPAAQASAAELGAVWLALWNIPPFLAPGQSQVLSSTSTTLSAVDSALQASACWLDDLGAFITCLEGGLPSCTKDTSTSCTDQLEACLGDIASLALCDLLVEVPPAWAACVVYYDDKAREDCKTYSTNCISCEPGAPILTCLQSSAQGCVSSPVPVIFARDPNSLNGPPGIGGQGWIAGAQALTYGISFGNESTATAPAQQVVVTQPLGTDVNLSTLSLPRIMIPNGTSSVQIPVSPGSFNPAAGVNEYTTNVDLRPTQSLLVNVDAKLTPTTQTLTWTFTSIDPTTGLPPLNPLVGFLPPGAGASVAFSVTPTRGIATGTQVAEQTTVVFDANPPLSTAVWSNTIDNTPPVSHVSALPGTSSCPDFRVSWSGSDIGSGLGGFTVYASANGSPFTPWLSNTTAASATYTGTVGNTYSFYSIATDLTGNVENAKTSAEASTTVTAAGPCGPPSLSGQVTNVSQSGTTVTVNLQLTNTGFTAAQAVNISKITPRTLSGSGTVTLASPALPAAEGSLAIGASSTVTLSLNVPATVTRFSLTESGNLLDGAGNTYNYSIAQTIIP
jgi:hypothetical protein